MDVDAIEEAFLRGEWGVALVQSKEQLAHSIVEVRFSSSSFVPILYGVTVNCCCSRAFSHVRAQIRQRAQDAEMPAMSANE